MKLGADWMIDVLDANDHETAYADFVPISEIVPGDRILTDDMPEFTVGNISLIRVRTARQTVRRYLVEPEDGEPFQLPAKRKVRRL